jgi:hypothetical protein
MEILYPSNSLEIRRLIRNKMNKAINNNNLLLEMNQKMKLII